LNRLRLIPFHAWPPLLRHILRRRLAARRRPPAPDLADSEFDFFFGGADALEQRLASPTFRFFSAADFGPPPTLETCDSILAHRIPILGDTFDVGYPVSWRRDFRTGYEWPRDHTSKLQLVTTRGDVKMPWELSRFHHGVTLALGYAATGNAHDERYPREWVNQFHAWRADNPPEYGPNWGNAMEAAIRAANWIAAFELVRPAFERATSESLLKALIQHGRFIASHLEEYWPPTNHIIANLCGLIWIGLFLKPDSKNGWASREPKRWLGFGLRELRKQLRIQILPDGASYEASTAYHRFVAEMVSTTVRLCELNGVIVPSTVRDTVKKMESVVESLRKPDGTLPLFGDEDGGMWLPHLPSPAKHPVVKRSGQGTGAGGEGEWQIYPRAGWYIYRDGDEYLAIRAGDNGQAGWGGHAHNDALSFEYAIGTRTFFVDPGTYAYTADPDIRNLFRSTAYHNTLRVDGQEISRIPPGELFRLENDAYCRGGRLSAQVWEGEHTGYHRIGVIHKRRFEKRADGWIIRDTVPGNGEHTLEWFFHFAPQCPVIVDGLKVRTTFPDDPNIQIETTQHATRVTLEEGWVSRTYGRREPAPLMRYSLRANLPVQVTFTVIRSDVSAKSALTAMQV